MGCVWASDKDGSPGESRLDTRTPQDTERDGGALLKDSGQSLNCSSVAPACW